MKSERKYQIEYGDFQTPGLLASTVCERLYMLGFRPDAIVEPTCGVGAFVLAAANTFPLAKAILGFEVNGAYLDVLRAKLSDIRDLHRIELEQADFFSTDWRNKLNSVQGSMLVIGNFPWVTNSVQGTIKGSNLPEKSNFLNYSGFDAISGKANFDISEWMLLEVLQWFKGRAGDVAMLVKTAVARKILAYAEQQKLPVCDAFIVKIDAKKEFNASVEACLLVIRLCDSLNSSCHDYTIFESLDDFHGHRVGHRKGLIVGDLTTFDKFSFLLGESPQKWRSGVKHDASSVMEFTLTERGLENGFNEVVELEPEYLFPLFKGSDVGSEKPWRRRYVLVTQRFAGESTLRIREKSPKTWAYFEHYANILDNRGSIIYKKNPRFSVFGIGDYAFRPWRIAICGLYKTLKFRLVGPIEGCPVMFDDTVYYLSFDTETEAKEVFNLLNSEASIGLLSSLIFWDEKRPVKTSILNVLDWSCLVSNSVQPKSQQMCFELMSHSKAFVEEMGKRIEK